MTGVPYGVSRTNVPPNPVPATLAASGSWRSGFIPIGFGALAVSAKLSQTGEISVQKYLDAALAVPVGSAITQALTANTLAAATDVTGDPPCLGVEVTISNSGGATGNLSDVVILTGPLP